MLTATNEAFSIKVKAIGGIGFVNSEYSSEITNMLQTPTGLTYATGLLTWNAVEDAVKYIVNINGEETEVSETSYTFTPQGGENYVIKVKAATNGAWFESEYNKGIGIRGKSQPEGYIADFADGTFVYDVGAVNVYNLLDMAATEYDAEYLENYEDANGVLRIDMTTGANTWAVVSLKLPETLVIDETLNSMSIKFRIEGIPGGDYAGLRVYGYGNDGAGRDLSPVTTYATNGINEWYTATITRETILYGFNNASSSNYMLFGFANVAGGTEISLYLDEISVTRN